MHSSLSTGMKETECKNCKTRLFGCLGIQEFQQNTLVRRVKIKTFDACNRRDTDAADALIELGFHVLYWYLCYWYITYYKQQF